MIAKPKSILDLPVTWGDNVRPVSEAETRAVLSAFYAIAAADTGEGDRYVPADYEVGLGDIEAERKHNRGKFRLPRGTDKVFFVTVQLALGQDIGHVARMLGWDRRNVVRILEWARTRGGFGGLRELQADVKGMSREEVERYIAHRC